MDEMWSTVAAERGALADDLAGLTDEQWETPSWCEGWTVHDVLAHQCGTADTGPGQFFVRLAASGFRFSKFADAQIRRHRGATPAETLETFRRLQHSTTAPPGPKTSWLGEVVVHSEDIRRPLGIDHDYPAEAVRRVIDFYKGSNTLIGAKSRIADLRLVATDQDWSHGTGPLVEGRLVDLLLAATGRAGACDRLSGDGVTTLRLRCG
ncbi:MAG TPA: maleylpyruvate isomerase family mycothiol-dependent enzyme [Nocardioides sp.]|uniref:maleylpyruvate isomerase family mycothiol-dependent enzyme n=1 Tax=Nocardioides sp. TaxID=35761 RepID=UPI002D804A79|nr:maleylpyruvate isomerase family mycothiol-dependent enzyme [Nocardioides sp.]HET6653681.1 maleylpyruvate isomerase family mycothiol-dependent enzyme [Nocardioides sp.]